MEVGLGNNEDSGDRGKGIIQEDLHRSSMEEREKKQAKAERSDRGREIERANSPNSRRSQNKSVRRTEPAWGTEWGVHRGDKRQVIQNTTRRGRKVGIKGRDQRIVVEAGYMAQRLKCLAKEGEERTKGSGMQKCRG